jgi:hypothetical protein
VDCVITDLSPLTLAPDGLAGLPEKRERFCAEQLRQPVLANEISDNQVGWTPLDLRCLRHRDEMVVREAALCVQLITGGYRQTG